MSDLDPVHEAVERLDNCADVDLPSDGTAVAPLKSLALGALVAATVSTMSLGERVLADRVAVIASRVLPVSEEVARLRGLLRRHGLEPEEGTA